MATLVLRTVKGTPLTNAEVDGNFSNINSEVGVVFNRANTINSNVGVLSNLTTTEKSNLVAAINEIASESTNNVTITAGTISNVSGSNINVLSGTIAGTVITNSTYQGNTIAIAYTEAKLANASNTAPIGASVSGNTLTLTHLNSGVTAATYGNATLIPVLTVNATGHITSVSNVTAGVSISDDTSTNSTFYIPITTTTSGTLTSAKVSTTKLTFNPSSGLLTSTDYNSSSDIALKENISEITNPVDIISKLHGFGFTWKETGERSFGLAAQEVEKILPEIVKSRPDGFKGINYLNIIAILVEAIKDLKKEVDVLKQK